MTSKTALVAPQAEDASSAHPVDKATLEKLLEKGVPLSDELVIGCQRGEPWAIAELDRKSSQKAVRKSAERIVGLPEGSLDAKKEAVKEVCLEEMRRLEQQRPPRSSARLE